MRASFNPIATAHSCHAHRHLVNLGRGDNSCPYILCVNIYVYIYMYRTCVCVSVNIFQNMHRWRTTHPRNASSSNWFTNTLIPNKIIIPISTEASVEGET